MHLPHQNTRCWNCSARMTSQCIPKVFVTCPWSHLRTNADFVTSDTSLFHIVASGQMNLYEEYEHRTLVTIPWMSCQGQKCVPSETVLINQLCNWKQMRCKTAHARSWPSHTAAKLEPRVLKQLVGNEVLQYRLGTFEQGDRNKAIKHALLQFAACADLPVSQ